MTRISQKITLIKYRKPNNTNLNNNLQWLGHSLGLFNLRDKDKSCFRLFIELIKAAKKDRMLSSDSLAEKLNLSRGTVIHHIKKLIDSGIVISKNSRYRLRVDNLSELVQEVEKDVEKTIQNLKEVAEIIDSKLRL